MRKSCLVKYMVVVDNNMDNQVLRIVKCMESVLNGNTKKYKKVWYSTPYAVTRE